VYNRCRFLKSSRELPIKTIPLSVNGQLARVKVDDPDMPLLYALRDNLGLHGPRFGCGLGQCGACTVHVDGNPVRSCVTPLSAVGKKKIVTLEGLSGPAGKLVAIQEAFITEQAAQCGFASAA
jgi:nicotinate dehydrogenase subunit A